VLSSGCHKQGVFAIRNPVALQKGRSSCANSS
jgi:hypothetical protein